MLRAYIEALGDDIFFVADKSDQFAWSGIAARRRSTLAGRQTRTSFVRYPLRSQPSSESVQFISEST